MKKLFIILLFGMNWSFSAYGGDFSCESVAEIPIGECEALVALYDSTNGAGWKVNTDWKVTDTPCSWYGVTCSGNILGLNLSGNQLTGSIPAELSKLSDLKALFLGRNQLTGSIPVELSKISMLRMLDLSDNQLTGSIPAELGNLSDLQMLSLSDNKLTGIIPTELGKLPLGSLYLSNNKLIGSIPNLNATLEYLDLSSNLLCRRASIDYSLWETKVNTYPICEENFTSCESITEIPTEECAALVALYDSTNGAGWTDKTGWKVTNTPCSWYGVTCKSAHIIKIRLYENQLTGSIPAELGTLSHLREFMLYSNQLTGNIPVEFGNLSNLETLNLRANQLTGSIPAELGKLPKLQYLNLEKNQFTGDIPDQLKKIATY